MHARDNNGHPDWLLRLLNVLVKKNSLRTFRASLSAGEIMLCDPRVSSSEPSALYVLDVVSSFEITKAAMRAMTNQTMMSPIKLSQFTAMGEPG